MKDSKGNGIVMGCYVRAHPREPRKPYKGWVVGFEDGALGYGEQGIIVENDRGHRETFAEGKIDVLVLTNKARYRQERMRDPSKMVSDRAKAGPRFKG